MTNIEKAYEFLNEAGTYFLATVDENKPRVRAFGTILLFDGKLYIQTGKKKDVSKQIAKNPNVEICACKGPDWIRISCKLINDDNRDIKVAMLEKMPSLRAMYNEDDGNMQMLYLADAHVKLASFVKPAEEFDF